MTSITRDELRRMLAIMVMGWGNRVHDGENCSGTCIHHHSHPCEKCGRQWPVIRNWQPDIDANQAIQVLEAWRLMDESYHTYWINAPYKNGHSESDEFEVVCAVDWIDKGRAQSTDIKLAACLAVLEAETGINYTIDIE